MNVAAEKPATTEEIGFRCGICRQDYIDRESNGTPGKAKEIADKCCICDRCDKPIPENDPKLGRGKRSWHDACSSKFQAEREAANIAKAKIDENWSGPVSFGDKYYGSIDELEESLMDDDVSAEDWPKFTYATKPITVSVDGDDFLYRLMESHELDSDFVDSLKGSEALLAAFKIFNEANVDSGFYIEDMNVVVPITPKEQL